MCPSWGTPLTIGSDLHQRRSERTTGAKGGRSTIQPQGPGPSATGRRRSARRSGGAFHIGRATQATMGHLAPASLRWADADLGTCSRVHSHPAPVISSRFGRGAAGPRRHQDRHWHWLGLRLRLRLRLRRATVSSVTGTHALGDAPGRSVTPWLRAPAPPGRRTARRRARTTPPATPRPQPPPRQRGPPRGATTRLRSPEPRRAARPARRGRSATLPATPTPQHLRATTMSRPRSHHDVAHGRARLRAAAAPGGRGGGDDPGAECGACHAYFLD